MRVVKFFYLFSVACALAALTACGSKDAQEQENIPAATVYTHVDSLVIGAGMMGDFDRTLALCDSLSKAGKLSAVRADNYRGIAYVNMGQMQKAVECFSRASADDNPPAEDFWEYINAGSSLANLQNAQHNLDGAIRTAMHFIQRLKQLDHPRCSRELHNLYFCLGNTQLKLARPADAEKSFDDAFHWLQLCISNDSTGHEMRTAMRTMENIAIAHFNNKQIDEAETWINREDSLLTIYKASKVADSVDVDFHHALISLHRAQICQERGQQADASRYYKDYTTSYYGKSAEGHIMSCAYLMSANRYDEAAYNYSFLDNFMEERSIEYDLETIGDELLPKFLSNYYAGRKDSALQMAKRIAEVYDSALVRQKRSDAAELAVVYDTQGKERQIAEEQARNRLTLAISIAVGIVALLSIIFAVYVYRQWRASKEKNRILAQQITEAVEYKEKYRQCQHNQQNLTQSIAEEQKVEHTVQNTQNGRVAISISDYTTLNEEQLFLCLRDLIENEKLFLQPDFGRQTLISHTGLSKEHIGAAFAQGSDRNSLPAYVRELRLDYAIRLMNDQPEMNIEQISLASGFTSADTFTRTFRAKYGMTPTAYKQTKDCM